MKDKLLNFLLIFLIIFIVMSFFDQKKQQTGSNQTLIIKSLKESYSIPASIKLSIQNNTGKDVRLNSCDIKIRSNQGDINLGDKEFCRDLIVKNGTTEILDYSKYFHKFYNIGDYFIETKIDGKDYMSKFSIESMGFLSKFFTFLFYAPFYNLIAFILTITKYSLFWTIIIITLIIRIILLHPQHKMMVSQAKMQAIQPKIKEIQDKYKGNHQVLRMELMKLYKEEKVNPMGSCLLLLIQMPILIVVYNILVSIQDPVNTYYLYSFINNFEISSINTKFYFIDLISVGGFPGLILAILVGIIQFIQIKLSLYYQNNQNKDNKGVFLEEKKQQDNYNTDSFMPDARFLNKFMLYGMPVMIAIFTYTFYIGVGIYWGISTLFMIFQQLVVNKILKKSSK